MSARTVKSPPTKARNGKSLAVSTSKKVVGSSVVVSPPSFSAVATLSPPSSTNSSASTSTSSLTAPSKAFSNSSTTKKRLVVNNETTSGIKKRLILDADESRTEEKLAAYDIDWFNPSATLIEHYKYTNDKNISVTQDEHLSFLLSKFETSDIKTAFADTVGKLGKPARDAFYPLPLRRDKVIRNFLLLIYDGRSIIVDDSKDGFR
jgi:hypothetical protein